MPIHIDDMPGIDGFDGASAEERLAYHLPPALGERNMWEQELNGGYDPKDAGYFEARSQVEDEHLFATMGALASEAVMPSHHSSSRSDSSR